MAETFLQLLEDSRLILVRTVDPDPFLDYLQNQHVLSGEDLELLKNPYIYRTRRERMRCFLDILSTRGPYGVELFMKQLGWEYAHVYREIFHKEPEAPPASYKQNKKSRLSCILDQIITTGFDVKIISNQNDKLQEQVRDMEAMLKNQCCEIDDLERENQRLHQFEKVNQHIQEQLRTLKTKNEEIKEENRQFLHEIRTLTLDLKKSRDQEAILQSRLDELTQNVQEKNFEINRMNKEESDLRARFERVRNESLRFQQSITHSNRQKQPPIKLPVEPQQDQLKQRVECLTVDIKNLEDTNKSLHEQLTFMQTVIDNEQAEHDKMHRHMCTLQRDKDNLEARLINATQKTERYFNRIREIEGQKAKLEEERMQMQMKCWEVNQNNEKQFEEIYKLENRYEHLHCEFEQFRQDHRYCVPGDSLWCAWESLLKLVEQLCNVPLEGTCRTSPKHERQGLVANCVIVKHVLTTDTIFEQRNSLKKDKRIQLDVDESKNPSGIEPWKPITNPPFQTPGNPKNPASIESKSLSEESPKGTSLSKLTKQENIEASVDHLSDSVEIDDGSDIDSCSTASEVSSHSSGFEFLEPSDPDSSNPSKIYIRLNSGIESIDSNLLLKEGDIVQVQEKLEDRWQVVKVEKTTGKLRHSQKGYILPLESVSQISSNGQLCPTSIDKQASSLERKNAFKYNRSRSDPSASMYSCVTPTKASHPLPVLLLGPSSVNNYLLEFLQEKAFDWLHVLMGTEISEMSTSQLFEDSDKHNILLWDDRPKDSTNNPYKFIIIIITLESEKAVTTLKSILNKEDLEIDYAKEMAKLSKKVDFMQKAGLNIETVTIRPEDADTEGFINKIKEKVIQVQQQVFWLQTHDKN